MRGISGEKNELEPIPIAAEAWNQRQLLASIIGRYFTIEQELGGLWPTWVVYPLVEDEVESDVHDSLFALNQHLENNDWMAELGADEPWVVKIKPRPIRQFTTTTGVWMFFWLGSFISTIIVGIAWLKPRHSAVEWYDIEIMIPVVLFYSLPFICTIALASFLQKKVAAKMGTRIGGIIPIMLPFPYFPWPFGVISIPTTPRMDDITWDDRHRLGLVSLVSPAVLLVCGLIFVLLGLYLTPQNTVLHALPIRLEFSLLPQALGTLLLGGEGYLLASSWSHPLALAGQGLMLMGWISLLPFPGLPGNRILVAELGLKATRSTGTQIALFLATCITGLMFGAFTGHQFWTFLTMLGALSILISGADTSSPRILDDIKPFNSSTLSVSHIIFLSLLLALPAEYPTAEVHDWDVGLDWKVPQFVDIDINSSENISIVVTSTALISRDWSIQGWSGAGDWNISWDCGGDILAISEVCSGRVMPLQSSEIILRVDSPKNVLGATGIELHFWLEDEDVGISSIMQIIPELPVVASSQYWDWDGNHLAPRICVDLSVDSKAPIGNVTLTSGDGGDSVLWSLENTSRIAVNPKEVGGMVEICAIGSNGAIHLLNSGEMNSKLLPVIGWIGDDGSTWSAALAIASTSSNLLSNGLAVTVDDSHPLFQSGRHLMLGEEDTLCDLDFSPRLPAGDNTTWAWDLNLRAQGLLPHLEEGQINLTLPESGWLHICEDSIVPTESWRISPTSNQELALTTWDGGLIDIWVSNSSDPINRTWELPVSDVLVRLHGDGIISASIEGATANLSLSASDSSLRATVIWLEVEADGKVLFNVASWSLEAVA